MLLEYHRISGDFNSGEGELGLLSRSCSSNKLTPHQLYAFTSMGVVILSTVVFILSTMPELADDIDMLPNTNLTAGQQVERWEDVREAAKK